MGEPEQAEEAPLAVEDAAEEEAIREKTPEELASEVWCRFDEVVRVVDEARRVGKADVPSPQLMALLEELADPFRHPTCIALTNLGGLSVMEFDFNVRRTIGELRAEVSDLTGISLEQLGLVHVETESLMGPDSEQVFAYGIRSGQIVQLAILISGLPVPDHAWDFRGATGDVKDKHTEYMARMKGDAQCTPEGCLFNGETSYVEIDPWTWKGPVTFEVRVRYNTYAHQAAVFALGVRENGNRVSDLFSIMSYTMFVVRKSLLSFARVLTEDNGAITLGHWFHMVATCQDGLMILYINGVEAGRFSEGDKAQELLRSAFLGKSLVDANYLDGTIAYFRIWHGAALKQDMVNLLYERSEQVW